MALQPVWKMVPDLMKNSKYQREGQGPECTVERDGKKYEIRMVHSTDEKTVQEIQELMEETFVKEEVDPIEVLKAAIDGRLFDGSKDIARYRLYVARDEAGVHRRHGWNGRRCVPGRGDVYGCIRHYKTGKLASGDCPRTLHIFHDASSCRCALPG